MKELKREFWSRVRKGETSARKEKWENAFNGRRTDIVQDEIPAVLPMGLILVNRQNHLLQPQKRRHRLTEESFANNIFGGTCTEPSCDFWHPLVCLNHKSDSGCKYGDKCKFLHLLRLVGFPVKSQRKVAQKDRWLFEKHNSIGLCHHDNRQRKSILRENEQLGSNHTVKFSKATMRRVKNRKRRVHRRESFKTATLGSEIHGLPKSRKERKTKP